MPKIKISIITISDRCSKKEAINKSGPSIRETLINAKDFNFEIVNEECCSDDFLPIEEILVKSCQTSDLVFTTGGTGFSHRDITPEVVKKVIEKEAPNLSMLMCIESLKITPLAALSRSVCGIRGKTVIITLPGSSKAAIECVQIVLPVLQHAIDLVKNDLKAVSSIHKEMENKVKSKVDVSKIATRDRKSPYEMIDVSYAVSLVLDQSFTCSSKTVNLTDALGCATSEDVCALQSLPPFPASIKDGYAVISSDQTSNIRIVKGQSCAGTCFGEEEEKLNEGFCIRINTGAPIPLGADAVIQVEDTELSEATADGKEEKSIKLLKNVSKGQDIRPIGSDILKGQILYQKGTTIGPTEIGVLASAGVVTLNVHEKPTVAVLSTGNELQSLTEQPLKTGRIFDSNKLTLIGLIQEAGFPATDAGIAFDEPSSLMQSICAALEKADILVTSGGVSMGDRDILRPVLQQDFNATIHFAQVFMKPGKPTTLATCNYRGRQKVILGLPGNPVSAVVTSHLYLFPLLKKMSGFSLFHNTVINAKLGFTAKLDPRPEYHRVNLSSCCSGEAMPVATSTGNQISSRLLSFTSAKGLALLPPKSEKQTHLEKGTVVRVIMIQF